jgi:hypothetical protein
LAFSSPFSSPQLSFLPYQTMSSLFRFIRLRLPYRTYAVLFITFLLQHPTSIDCSIDIRF